MQSTAVLPIDTDAMSSRQLLSVYHYLGPISRGLVYRDALGVIVFANPTSRRLPQTRWVEVVRWCIVSGEINAGSMQWRSARKWLESRRPEVTTVVSYSDPSVGHTGALYRACNWLWAPSWHRLREPPTGQGAWTNGHRQAAKDRWVYCLRPDGERSKILAVKDAAVMRRMPWAQYVDGKGGDYKRWLAFRGAK